MRQYAHLHFLSISSYQKYFLKCSYVSRLVPFSTKLVKGKTLSNLTVEVGLYVTNMQALTWVIQVTVTLHEELYTPKWKQIKYC